ncbi:MAG: hypothetical protein K6G50_13035 [bacterium]|nr:hypothetical protein [bacterium]
MSAKPDFSLALLAGLAIGLAHVFLYGIFCNYVKKYLERAADFTCDNDNVGSAEEKSLADSGNGGEEQKFEDKKRVNQGISIFQRMVLFTALCRIAVTAFLAWLAICACSLPEIPVVVGFAVASGIGLIKLARTSAEDR